MNHYYKYNHQTHKSAIYYIDKLCLELKKNFHFYSLGVGSLSENGWLEKLANISTKKGSNGNFVFVDNNFNNIISYTQNKLNNAQSTYQLSTTDYQTRLNSINQNSMIGNTSRASLISSIPPPSGLNISNDDITIAVNKIVNTENTFLQNLQKQAILPLQEKLAELKTQNAKLQK